MEQTAFFIDGKIKFRNARGSRIAGERCCKEQFILQQFLPKPCIYPHRRWIEFYPNLQD